MSAEELFDRQMLCHAIELARYAASIGEVPVGAVVVCEGEIIASGYNRREIDQNALAHAELLAIEGACKALGRWRLLNCCLYVTLEPCAMCTGAIINSRIDRVVFGASDPKAGCLGSVTNLVEMPFNHKPVVVGGVLADCCAALLSDFFAKLRESKKN